MNYSIDLIPSFIHKAPKGYSYEVEQFNNRLFSIWLNHKYPYTYKTKNIRTIWGFYSLKKLEYYSPINSSKCGSKVNIKDTTPYTAMQLNLSPLERAFV